MNMAEEEHEGASVQEILIEACRRNNTDLLQECIEGKSEDEISKLMNQTTTVLGNHLYHEAASRGHYEIIDLLLDQPSFECDPVSRAEGDTPLHTAVRWLNAEPPEQDEFGVALLTMMLEAGSNPRVKNKHGLKPSQLVDPRRKEVRELLDKAEYNEMDGVSFLGPAAGGTTGGAKAAQGAQQTDQDEDDGDFSGSDEDERAEWEARKNNKS